MIWYKTTASDDMGNSPEVPRRDDLVYVAQDPLGCWWTISLHDDGTWNLVRTNVEGAFVQGAAGFKSPEAGMVYADRVAASMMPAPLDNRASPVR